MGMTGTEWEDLEHAEDWPSFRQRLPHAPDGEALTGGHEATAEDDSYQRPS
jgi:hypothetical protein